MARADHDRDQATNIAERVIFLITGNPVNSHIGNYKPRRLTIARLPV